MKWAIKFPRAEVPVQFSITPSMGPGNKSITRIKLTYGKDAILKKLLRNMAKN